MIFYRNSIILLISEMILKFKAFILVPILTKSLGTIDYGIWSQINIINTFIYPLILLGTDSAILRFLPGENFEKQKNLFSNWIIFLMIPAVLFTLLIVLCPNVFAYVFFGANDNKLKTLVSIAAINIIITVLINAFKLWYRVLNNYNGYAFLIILQSLLNFISIYITVFFLKSDLFFIIFATIISDIIVALVFFLQIFNFKNLKIDYEFYKKIIVYGYVLIPAAYFIWAMNSLDRIFLANFCDLSDVGIYSLSFSLGYLVIQLFVNTIYTTFPAEATMLYKKNKITKMLQIEIFSKRFFCIVITMSIIFFIVLGEDIIILIANQEFSKGSKIIPLIILSQYFQTFASYSIVKLGLINKQVYHSIALGIAVLLNFIINFLLVPIYGITGAVISLIFSYGVEYIFLEIVLPKDFRVFDYKYYFKVVIYGFAICVMLYFLNLKLDINVLLKIVFFSLITLFSFIKFILNLHKAQKEIL